jgi:outer membrane protein assembly factor BamA
MWLTRCAGRVYVVDTAPHEHEVTAGLHGVPTVPAVSRDAVPFTAPSILTLLQHLKDKCRAHQPIWRALWWRVVALTLTACVLVPRAAEAQRDACDAAELEVRSLMFTGNRAFTNSQLARVIQLTASAKARRVALIGSALGTRGCGAESLIAIDRARLVIYYRRRGFPDVVVDTNVQRTARTMAVRFAIAEGRATTIDTLRVAGGEGVVERERVLRNLPLRRGEPFDQYLLEQSRDSLRRRLADVGYPFAQVLLATDVLRGAGADSLQRTAVVEFVLRPGPYVTIGNVSVQATARDGKAQQIPTPVVQSLVGLTPGDRYEQTRVERATRALYQTDAYQQVRIEPNPLDAQLSGDTARVDVVVNVVERFMHTRTLSAGYGTLDCFRTQLQYTDRNLLRRARRLELTARLSKLGIGKPVDFQGADALCGAVANGNDPYSDRLNYYVGATLRPPTGPGGLRIPEVTLYSEVRGEFKAYRRTTPIGAIASVTLQAAPRVPVTLAYDLSFGKTEAQPALFCSVLNRCAPDDRRVFETTRRIAVIGANFSRDRTDDPINPRHGSFARLSLRHASRLTLSDTAFQFTSAVFDASRFWGLGLGSTLAVRLQIGAVFGSNERLVPPQERLYAGGPTTVRGFRQNELGPIAYVVNPDDTPAQAFIRRPISADTFALEVNPSVQPFRIVPVGGNTVTVGNVELRLRSPFLPTLLQWTLFTDVGQAWSRGASDLSLRTRDLRITPGLGARVFSPIGVIRLDLGYNNYAQRAGAAYFNDLPRGGGAAQTQALLCVSPGNTIPATEQVDGAATYVAQSPYVTCPGTYAPARNRGILGPFTFFFAIGQAF